MLNITIIDPCMNGHSLALFEGMEVKIQRSPIYDPNMFNVFSPDLVVVEPFHCSYLSESEYLLEGAVSSGAPVVIYTYFPEKLEEIQDTQSKLAIKTVYKKGDHVTGRQIIEALGIEKI